MSLNVKYNYEEINAIILENTLKMLERRKLIKSWSDEFNKLNIDKTSKTTFEITLPDKNIYSIYLVSVKLASIVQGTPLDDYLSNNIGIQPKHNA